MRINLFPFTAVHKKKKQYIRLRGRQLCNPQPRAENKSRD